ncbi:hypothetical protein SCORR_v1c06780 [Spiroplasma corruscae]|uniref:DUF262 domain-containing protein n=1 Tax=Spiroplasma corruscae TaxID=216934 RepID=A0A222EPK1_9MOLU|nr:DUF262 domain-containing protein [Spiroplasma corruscae]ASP28450.1 hypothetical protein SCORR_v1c06780 [Spiroplasma corruscae]
MISNNFKFLEDYYEYKWIIERMSTLEDLLIVDEDYNGVLIESYTFLEEYLKELLSLKELRKLGEMKNMLRSMFMDRKQKKIEGRILNFLDYIMFERNSRFHAPKDDINVEQSKPSFLQCVTILKNLKSIINYFVIEIDGKDIEVKTFDENIYFVKSSHKNIRDEEEKFFDDPQINIYKTPIGKLVLDKNKLFTIPPYQRDYRWTPEECSELLDQVIDKSESNELIYFGTIACKYEVSLIDNSKLDIKLIDGQQRVTTSLILFKAIYDIMKSADPEDYDYMFSIPDELEYLFNYKENGIYSPKRINEKYRNFASDKRNATDSINLILRGYSNRNEFEEELRHKLSKNQILDNYYYFYNSLKNLSIENLEKIYEYYYNKFIISFIVFDNNENNNEMEIFENLNSKGKDLDTFDMIKNYIFNSIDEKVFKIKSNELVPELTKYFKMPILKNGVKKSLDEDNKKYEEFLFNLITYLDAINDNKDLIKFKIQKNKKSLLKNFKRFYKDSNLSEKGYLALCSDLGRYFHVFKVVRIGNLYESSSNEFYEFGDILKNLSHKDFSLLIFYLVDIYSDKTWNPDDRRISLYNKEFLRDCLFEIEKWSSLLVQTRGTGQSFKESTFIKLIKYLKTFEHSNEFKKNLPLLIKNWFSGDAKFDKLNEDYSLSQELTLPTKEEIINSFKNQKVQNVPLANVFLSRLEQFWMNSRTKANQNISFGKTSLEHIVPQTLSSDWKNMLSGGKPWNKVLEDKYKERLDKIGNLLLLDLPNNSEIKNSSFQVKQKSYKDTDSRLAKVPYGYNNANLLTIDQFTFDDIDERSSKIASIIVNEIYNI